LISEGYSCGLKKTVGDDSQTDAKNSKKQRINLGQSVMEAVKKLI